MTSVAVVGGGKIGEALIAGLIEGGTNPKDIHVSNRREERGTFLLETYGIVPFDEPAAAVDGVDVAFLCVKPKVLLNIADEISDVISNNDATTVVSMAAGVSCAAIEEVLSAGAPVVRAMPNTPMLVNKGMIALAPGRFVEQEQLNEVVKLISATGRVRLVLEQDIDAVTAMSGSSPAYFFLMIESMIDAGVALGLSRDAAQELSITALDGAAAMLRETGADPAHLRANVSSPGGATTAAIREFEESGFRGMVYRATAACAKRSGELG
ncbi:pyrroline-5-carboxylate reductase [Corynebacterium sp. ES2794-CONJ1]|uniref:pyrroline-5-carboxylate reductase n=1 Tax=unclassified Corynebacterium TaxID=2624378 RepID=UPI00216A18CE|nr:MULTISPECIES: pyrroline-5-carboxylate reductase [unclassified Corynebacterium]MCS4489726.1 pyrroline-5-carboxylate reductase [Corynebacterium sp. ES2775-CONJ]MCS4491265.1 pyrroline-5-carboxylate reductase [Corynebacterium sp. ES2715-CONJ3]MCS4531638.1 pyrroline-5-carboxylate reductase [Corynebacterium sp. ES2730-CONJ]MCU9519034.1 pyrroline-5-carboxylate reductase [Corynebacterium sp. ES2794-CONJ1]